MPVKSKSKKEKTSKVANKKPYTLKPPLQVRCMECNNQLIVLFCPPRQCYSHKNEEIEDLKEFQNLKGINASNNKFTNLDALLTLPNKNKVEKINFFGNQIQEVDLAKIFTEFPNLKYLNLDYNPLSAKNLEQLTSEQFSKLVEGMKNKQIKISASKGSVLADLLEYTQYLVKNGDNFQRQQAHRLQSILENGSAKNEQQSNNSKLPWVIGGIVVVSLALVVGYLLGKKRKELLD